MREPPFPFYNTKHWYKHNVKKIKGRESLETKSKFQNQRSEIKNHVESSVGPNPTSVSVKTPAASGLHPPPPTVVPQQIVNLRHCIQRRDLLAPSRPSTSPVSCWGKCWGTCGSAPRLKPAPRSSRMSPPPRNWAAGWQSFVWVTETIPSVSVIYQWGAHL